MPGYHARLDQLCEQRGRLCVGIDPHPQILTAWGLSLDVTGLEACARGMVEALGETVAVFKPQSAFFEAFGPSGVAVLARVLADIKASGAFSILDVKRGDIGSTMAAYATAYLADAADLAADAITVSPYLGFEALRPALDLAAETGRGIYVLCRTSNPEGADVQLARPAAEGPSVAQAIVQAAIDQNTRIGRPDVGLVIGATRQPDVDLEGFEGSILAPGIGAQGASIDDLSHLFGSAGPQVLPSASREVLSAGPDPELLRKRVHALLG